MSYTLGKLEDIHNLLIVGGFSFKVDGTCNSPSGRNFMNMNGVELWSRAIMRKNKLEKKCKKCLSLGFMARQMIPAAVLAGIFTYARARFIGYFPCAIEELSVGAVGFSVFFMFYYYLAVAFALLMLPECVRKLHLMIQIWRAGLDIERFRPVRKWSFDDNVKVHF